MKTETKVSVPRLTAAQLCALEDIRDSASGVMAGWDGTVLPSLVHAGLIECPLCSTHPVVLTPAGRAALAATGAKPWIDVPLFWLDGRGALTYEHRLEALREYRRTDGMYLVVLADPATLDGSIGAERALCHAGPSADEIDWTGFDAALAATGAKP